MNCQTTPHSITSCPNDNYHGCLVSYVGLIGKQLDAHHHHLEMSTTMQKLCTRTGKASRDKGMKILKSWIFKKKSIYTWHCFMWLVYHMLTFSVISFRLAVYHVFISLGVHNQWLDGVKQLNRNRRSLMLSLFFVHSSLLTLLCSDWASGNITEQARVKSLTFVYQKIPWLLYLHIFLS